MSGSFRARISWQYSPTDMGRAIDQYGERVSTRALVPYLEKHAGEIQAGMQREASWTDRTGEARKKLSATVEQEPRGVSLYLAHGVDYGKYLELSNGGRFAIIGPTIPRAGVRIMNDLRVRMRQ